MNKKYIKIVNKKNFFNFFSLRSNTVFMGLLTILTFNFQDISGAYLSNGQVYVSSNTDLLSNKTPQIFAENALFLGAQDNESSNAVMGHEPNIKKPSSLIGPEKFLPKDSGIISQNTSKNDVVAPIKRRPLSIGAPTAPSLGKVQGRGVSSVVGTSSSQNSSGPSFGKKTFKTKNLRLKNRKSKSPKGKNLKNLKKQPRRKVGRK